MAKPFVLSLLLLAALVAAIVLWRDPYLLVRAEFARQRVAAGLSAGTVEAAGHRWAYAYREADDRRRHLTPLTREH